MYRYKIVKQDRYNTDQYLYGFYETSEAAYSDIKRIVDTSFKSKREDFHVKKIDPRFILNPVGTDYDHYIWSLIPAEERKRVMASDASAEIVADSVTCNSMRYWMLSEMIWKEWNVIDIGCGYNAQSYLFTGHNRYIAVSPDAQYETDGFHFEHFQAPNTEYFDMTGQKFIRDVLPTLGLSLGKTFVICHFVPSDECQKMVRENFRNVFVLYP